MAARKKSGGSRPRRGGGKTHIPRTPTRDPGPTGNVGCYVLAFSMLGIVLLIVLLEVLG
ncbi:hypothetical protein [Allosalinactinospora lopnorensis]|uniref:hypothetical protein n=1 Tax=Allosalinactinospora lopnorensis TaxID=1352348 RepID=UPI001569078F|nr:hypothetical protein [Allosalinactinospora lopnorensis]